jgi:hypothetical protein
MRLFGKLGYTNDGVERCRSTSGLDIRRLKGKPYMYTRLLESPTRGGHRGTKNQSDSMWAAKHHPDINKSTLGCGENSCIKSNANHRKMSCSPGRRSY